MLKFIARFAMAGWLTALVSSPAFAAEDILGEPAKPPENLASCGTPVTNYGSAGKYFSQQGSAFNSCQTACNTAANAMSKVKEGCAKAKNNVAITAAGQTAANNCQTCCIFVGSPDPSFCTTPQQQNYYNGNNCACVKGGPLDLSMSSTLYLTEAGNQLSAALANCRAKSPAQDTMNKLNAGIAACSYLNKSAPGQSIANVQAQALSANSGSSPLFPNLQTCLIAYQQLYKCN